MSLQASSNPPARDDPHDPLTLPMQFPRSSQLDDRRRRVLTEEVIGGAVAADAAPAEKTNARAKPRRRLATQVRPYGDAALIDRQPRITDLAPQHYGIIALLFLAGVTIVAGLETLYVYMPDLARRTPDGTIAAFDLAGEGSLAAWFSSATLLLAGVMSLLVYSIRRHKADDYHGRYRVWLWSAGCSLVMSMDESGSLHEGFKELMSYATGQRGFGDGSIWWVGAYALTLGAVGMRLLLEMCECRASTTALVFTGGCYGTAVLARLGFVMPDAPMQEIMLEEGCEMVGNLFLLLAAMLHARYVILDAQGLIPPKAAKPAKAPKADKPAKADKGEKKAEAAAKPAAEPESAGRSWFRKTKIDPAHNNPPPPKQQPSKNSPPAAVAAKATSRRADAEQDYDYEDEPRGRQNRKPKASASDDDAAYGDERRMTRAERKALRRERDRQRHGDE